MGLSVTFTKVRPYHSFPDGLGPLPEIAFKGFWNIGKMGEALFFINKVLHFVVHNFLKAINIAQKSCHQLHKFSKMSELK